MSLVEFALTGAVKSGTAERIAGSALTCAEEILEATGKMAREAQSTPYIRQLSIRTGMPVYVDLAESGPLSFARMKPLPIEKLPKVASGCDEVGTACNAPKPELSMDHIRKHVEGGRPALSVSPRTALSPLSVLQQPTHWEPHPLLKKINFGGNFALRESPKVTEPIANLGINGNVDSLMVPFRTKARDLSEIMAITTNANRIFSDPLAFRAAQFVTRETAGFNPQIFEAPARSAQEMLGYALKGSTDWIEGASGNNYTRYLNDWHGEFTPSNRKLLHTLYTGKIDPVRSVLDGELLALVRS